jgi:hypothetical protein
MSRATKARGRYAVLSRHRSDPSDPDLLAAKTDLDRIVREEKQAAREAKLRELIKEQVEAEPPLTEAQRNRLAVLLRGGDHDAAA